MSQFSMLHFFTVTAVGFSFALFQCFSDSGFPGCGSSLLQAFRLSFFAFPIFQGLVVSVCHCSSLTYVHFFRASAF